jgi:hypothetical protein
MKTNPDRVVLLLTASWAALGSSAQGDFSYDFSSPPPASFETGVIGPPSDTFATSFANGMLRLGDSRTPAQGGIGGTVGFGAFGLEQSQTFGDVRISAVLNPSGDSDDVVNVTRGHGGVGVYGAGIDFSSGRLETFKLLPGGLVPIIFSSDQSNQGSGSNSTNLSGTWDNFSATAIRAIPEPASALLMFAGITTGLSCCHRRSRRD